MSLATATRSEITKQFSTSTWWILAIVLFVYVAFVTGGLAAAITFLADGASGEAGMPTPDGAPTLLYSFAASLGYVFALLIGALMVTTEYRHKTLTPTLLATPQRGSALLAKVVVAVFIGVLYAVIALVAAVLPGAGLLAIGGEDAALGDVDTWALFGRILLALVLWTVIGVGVGALVRNQVAAVVGVLAFTQFLEPIVRLAASFVDGLSDVAAFLPGAASDTLVGASFLQLGATAESTLDWWGGGIVLAVYAVVFLFLGYLTSWRRDVA